MNTNELKDFQKLHRQLTGLCKDMETLSTNSPEKIINEFKLKLINRLLVRISIFLGNELQPFSDFCELKKESTYSDVVVFANQFLVCFEEYRARNIRLRNGQWFWVVVEKGDGEEEYIPIDRFGEGTDEGS